jgi:hypothetical protein
MALSGTWSFTVVRDDIIRESMLNVGAIGESEIPTAQEVTDCARKLNMLTKQWMSSQDFAPGLKMWERQRGDLFLVSNRGQYQLGPVNADHWAGGVTNGLPGQTYGQTQLTANANATATVLPVASTSQLNVGDQIGILITSDIYWTTISSINTGASTVTIPAPGLPALAVSSNYVWNYTFQAQRPLAIVTCVLRDINNNDTPMNTMTVQDYEILPSKAQTTFQSDPTAYYYESQFVSGTSNQGPGQLYLDIGGAQDTTKHLHIVYMRPIMDFNNPGDNPEYPQQWYRALCWGLSREICGMFDAIWTQDMDMNYRESVAMAREADSETTSMYFQINANDPFSP